MARLRRSPATTVLIVILLLLCALPVFAQDDADATEVFAPFVSRLRVSVRDPQVRLTWRDAEDVSGPYLIYRHTEPITDRTISDATFVGSVEDGVQSFIDTPDYVGSYYYAVLAEMEDQVPYPIYISGRNTTYNAVTIENTETVPERSAVATSISAEVTELGNQPAIRILFEADKDDRHMIVYRSTEPFDSLDDVQDAAMVRETASDSGSVIDMPVPGVAYYYAVADTEAILGGAVTFVAGANTTAEPIEIPLVVGEEPVEAGEEPAAVAEAETPAGESGETAETAAETEPATAQAEEDAEEETEGAEEEPAIAAEPEEEPEPEEPGIVVMAPQEGLRPISTTRELPQMPELPSEVEPVLETRPSRPVPLPFLALQTEVATGADLEPLQTGIPTRSIALSQEAQNSVTTLLESLQPLPPLVVYPAVLDDDRLPDPQGAEAVLREIVQGAFARREWQDAIDGLDDYFSLPLTPELAARGHFYRAQARYFLGEQQAAFAEFLLARDFYYVDVAPWVDLILNSSSGV